MYSSIATNIANTVRDYFYLEWVDVKTQRAFADDIRLTVTIKLHYTVTLAGT